MTRTPRVTVVASAAAAREDANPPAGRRSHAEVQP